MTDPRPLPTRRQVLEALLVAALCAVAFLRMGVLPTRAVVPFPPERYEPLHSEVLTSGAMTQADIDVGSLQFGDKYNQSLAWDRITQDRLRGGSIPRWSRDIAGGVPFVPQMAQPYQPWNVLLLLPIPSAGIYGIWWLLHLCVWGVGCHWFLRRLGIGHQAAILGLVVACLGLWTQARVHHNVILSAALPLWPLLTLVDAAFRGGGIGPGRIALIGLCLGISWSGGFAPVSLQVTLLGIAFALFSAWRTRHARPLAGIGLGFALGGLLALPQMGPTLLAAAHSSRDAATAAELAATGLTWSHLTTLFWPDLLHWPAPVIRAGESYPAWAALEALPDLPARTLNFPETAFAIGIPGALLAMLGVVRGGAVAWFFGGVFVLGFGLATAATPFLELSAAIPGARAGDLKRFLFLVSIALTVLAAHGADHCFRLRPARVLAIGAAVVALLSGVWLVQHLAVAADVDAFRRMIAEQLAGEHVTPAGQSVQISVEQAFEATRIRPAEAGDNLAMRVWTYGRSLVVALATILVLLLAPGRARVPALAALVALELLAAGAGTIVPVPVERVQVLPATLAPVAAATADAEARSAPRPRLFRLERAGVVPKGSRLFPPNLGAYHGIEDLAAYSPLPKARMEELFEAIEPPKADGAPSIALGGSGVMCMLDPATLHHPVLDLLGCRFVLAARALEEPLDAARIVDRTPPATPPPFRLYERTTTLPRATFVDRAELVTDAAERLAVVADPVRDFTAAVVLEDAAAPIEIGDGVPDADVEVVRHADEAVVVRVENREPGYLRLADPWDAGWTATVDGAAREVLRADHYVRAVHLAPGVHEVVFRYDALPARIWPWLGILGLSIAALLGAAGARRARAR